MSDEFEPRLEAVNAGPSFAKDIAVRVQLSNTGPAPVSIPAQVLSSPSLLFELIDEMGGNVRFPPPPVPDPGAGAVEIDAGESWQKQFVGFLPELSPGTYQLRVSIRGEVKASSDWLPITLR